jgi:hypothetical protein
VTVAFGGLVDRDGYPVEVVLTASAPGSAYRRRRTLRLPCETLGKRARRKPPLTFHFGCGRDVLVAERHWTRDDTEMWISSQAVAGPNPAHVPHMQTP